MDNAAENANNTINAQMDGNATTAIVSNAKEIVVVEIVAEAADAMAAIAAVEAVADVEAEDAENAKMRRGMKMGEEMWRRRRIKLMN